VNFLYDADLMEMRAVIVLEQRRKHLFLVHIRGLLSIRSRISLEVLFSPRHTDMWNSFTLVGPWALIRTANIVFCANATPKMSFNYLTKRHYLKISTPLLMEELVMVICSISKCR